MFHSVVDGIVILQIWKPLRETSTLEGVRVNNHFTKGAGAMDNCEIFGALWSGCRNRSRTEPGIAYG